MSSKNSKLITQKYNIKFKSIIGFSKKNYFLIIFFAAILFVGVIAGTRLFLSEPTYIYAKVKMGQGLWWASTQKPSIWQVDAINKGDIARGLTGRPEAEVLSKKVYRWYGSDQFDIYLTLQLTVSGNQRKGYNFNRSALSVGSPIEIQFPKAELTGTVIDLSSSPFKEELVEKTMTISKSNAYPWEFDAIHIGDSYFDGENVIFEVIDKRGVTAANLVNEVSNLNVYSLIEPRMRIEVDAKVLVRKVNGQWVLGEDQIVTKGKGINISTPGFVFENYLITEIK